MTGGGGGKGGGEGGGGGNTLDWEEVDSKLWAKYGLLTTSFISSFKSFKNRK